MDSVSAPIAFSTAFVTGSPVNSFWSFRVSGRSFKARVLDMGALNRKVVTVYAADNTILARKVVASARGATSRNAIAQTLRSAALA